MANFVLWLNNNEGFTSFLLALLSLIIAIIAIIISVKSIKQVDKQIQLSKEQQKQNEGLNLYPLRREFLSKYTQNNFDDIYWDADVLFSRELAEEIRSVGFSYQSHLRLQKHILIYENELKLFSNEMYNKYCVLLSKIADDEIDEEILFAFTDEFSPMIQDSSNEEEILIYRNLYMNAYLKKSTFELQSLKCHSKIVNEIKNSLLIG